MRDSRATRFTRRDVIRLFGAGAGVGLAARVGLDAAAEPLREAAAGVQATDVPRGAIIRTILRDIDPSSLTGITLMHEHVGSGRRPSAGARGAAQPRLTEDPVWMADELKSMTKDGVACIVAATTNIPGSETPGYLKQLAERSGIHIVPTGALYTKSSYPPDVATKSEDQIADDIVRAAVVGRFGAFGELAVTPGATEIAPEEKKVYRAFTKASLRTGIPIFTHNNYATGPNIPIDIALRQLDVFEAAGADPRHLAIGHVCCLDDTTADVPKRLAKRGVFVAFDRLTRQQQWVTDDQKLKTILAFLDAGFADHCLFSSDYSGSVNTGVGEKEFRTGPFHAHDGGPGWARSVVWFHPMLRKAGVKEDVMRRITVENPRRFLAFVPKQV